MPASPGLMLVPTGPDDDEWCLERGGRYFRLDFLFLAACREGGVDVGGGRLVGGFILGCGGVEVV